MALIIASSFAIGVLLLVLTMAARAGRQRRRWHDQAARPLWADRGDWEIERRNAEQRFVQALEVQDFERAETELRTIMSGR